MQDRDRTKEDLLRELIELRESSKQYRLLVEAANSVILTWDTAGTILFVNEYCERFFGFSKEELIGRNVVGTIVPETESSGRDLARLMQEIQKDPDRFRDNENENITRDGRRVWIRWANKAITGKNGRLTGILSVGNDITERNKAEERLRASEDRFRALTESTSDWIWEVDENARYTYASPKVKDLLGYEPEEIIGKTPFDLMPPDEARRVSAQFGLVVEDRLPITRLENVNLHKDGHTVVLETSGVPIIDGDGHFKGYRGIDRDVTQRKLAEEASRLTRFTVDNVADAVYWIDSKAQIVDVNETARSMLGYTREEFLNLTVLDINPDLSAERWGRLWETLKVQGKITLETRHLTKDGRIIPVEIMANYLSFGGTELDCAFARDITDRKKAEDYLRESENKFRILAEKSPNMIFINQMGRIVYANERCAEVMGYTRDEFYAPDFDFLCLIAPEYVDLVTENFRKHMQGRELPSHEYSLVTKEGMRVEAIITMKLIDYGNRPAILGIVTDITERKKMEETLLESEKSLRLYATQLEESNSALKVLLRQREDDKRELEEKIMANIKQLILPYLEKLKRNRLMSDDLVYLNILESNLKEIVSPFSASLSSTYSGLTPKEMLIANLVKDGRQDKEICEILNISLDTVKVHRKNIRKKLGITGNRINLRTHLFTISTR